MTEQTPQFKEQISVFVDDEMSSEQCEFFVRRLQRDEESRNCYRRYHLIGAAIRGEHVRPDHGDLRQRLRIALDAPDEAPLEPASGSAIWRIAAGGGIAAAVALVAVFALRFNGLAPDELTTVARSMPPDAELELVEPPSYVVPMRVPEQRVVTPPVRLVGLQYLVHHGGYASRLSRTVVHSNVVTGNEPDIAVEAVDEPK